MEQLLPRAGRGSESRKLLLKGAFSISADENVLWMVVVVVFHVLNGTELNSLKLLKW